MKWSWAAESLAWSITKKLARVLQIDAQELGEVIVAHVQKKWNEKLRWVSAADLCGPCKCRLTHEQPCYCERDE